MTRADATSGRVYFPELDGLRFLAFLLVFGSHGGLPWATEVATLVTLPLYVISIPFGSVASEWTAGIAPGFGRSLRVNGWVGVQLFFILSGFLITTLLLREEERFGRVDLRAFWVRRILRIWPLYYLTVAVTFFLLPALDGRLRSPGYWSMLRVHLPWFLGFLGNWSMIRHGPVGNDAISVLWSVCVEEQFYILCPLLIILVNRHWRLPVVGALMAAAVGLRGWLASGNPDQMRIQYNTFAQLDTLLSGVALALVLERWPPGELAARAAAFWSWPVLAATAWLWTRPQLAHVTALRQTWDYVGIWLCGLGIVALPILRPGRLRNWLAVGWMVWLGRISYGLYMDHEVALWSIPSTGWLAPFLALGLTIVLAAVSYYGFERPFLRLKKAWTRVPSRPV
jgi:peptidoglycan/LPS O-acetylase OafA/YrhL